jgi:hypothetical protein
LKSFMSLKNKLKHWLRGRDNPNSPVLLRFEGGMGNQLLNAAVYFHLESQGREVYADLRYFDQRSRVAQLGDEGAVSLWPWQLDHFGIRQDRFQAYDPAIDSASAPALMPDGSFKLLLALHALADPDIRKHFPADGGIDRELHGAEDNGYLCMHIRRGDYVNVASHLVSDDHFVAQAIQFSGLLPCVVVLSDSPIPDETRSALQALYPHAHFLDQTDAWTAHRIMRHARVLVCSNSQFSLIGAALNAKALILLPMTWFGGDGMQEQAVEAALRGRSPFMVMHQSNVSP